MRCASSGTLAQPVDIVAHGLFDIFERVGFGGELMFAAQFDERFDTMRIVRPALRQADRPDVQPFALAGLHGLLVRRHQPRRGADLIAPVRAAYTLCHFILLVTVLVSYRPPRLRAVGSRMEIPVVNALSGGTSCHAAP